jgi:DNA-binding PadR family transcriptional regulator
VSRLHKACKCPASSYVPIEKKFTHPNGVYLEEITYIVDQCRNHPYSYGTRKNEVHRIYYENPMPAIPEMAPKELDLISKVFQSCKEKKILKTKWERETTDGLSESEKALLFDKLMQAGLIELLEEYNSTNSKKRDYIIITEKGLNALKSELGVIENDQQIELSKAMIRDTITFPADPQTPQLRRLIELLRNQLKQIEEAEPYWEKQNGEKIKPQTVQKAMPLYYIITKTLCTWVRYYRVRMTKRELSCLSFSGDSMIRDADPSKVLDSIYESLEQIIVPTAVGFEDLEAFGLIKTLELVQLSGSAELRFSHGQSIRISGPLSVINSF